MGGRVDQDLFNILALDEHMPLKNICLLVQNPSLFEVTIPKFLAFAKQFAALGGGRFLTLVFAFPPGAYGQINMSEFQTYFEKVVIDFPLMALAICGDDRYEYRTSLCQYYFDHAPSVLGKRKASW
jgi:hypothetical protein